MKHTITNGMIGAGGITLSLSLMDIVNGIISLVIGITTLIYLIFKARMARHEWRTRTQ